MPCIFNSKPADRHCEYCAAVLCDERPPKPYEVITRSNLKIIKTSNKMSKAEERAYEHFPNEDIDSKKARFGFLLGYHQAEKDLELSWEDIEAIDQIFTDVFKDGFDVITNKYYQEVLKRFKERKGE